MNTETHIDGDTIKGPHADGYPFLAENVAPEYLKLFAYAPMMLAALKALMDRVDSEVAYGDEWPEFEVAGAVIDRAEGR